VLKGEDAFNFEMRRLEVEHMSKEQRAENRRKLEERIANAKKITRGRFFRYNKRTVPPLYSITTLQHYNITEA